MTHPHPAELTATEAPFGRLSDRENARAVDLIESAERSAPWCVCGRHMIAVAMDGDVWLECSTRQRRANCAIGVLSRFFAGFNHTRNLIMQLPETT